MNWAFNIQEKTKISLGFSFILIMVLIINWFLSYNIKIISSEFKSIYEDRLIPAVDISNILEKNFENRFYLEKHILSNNNYYDLEKKILKNFLEMDFLIKKFEKTFLVNEESLHLDLYKKKIKLQKKTEEEIMKLSKENNKKEAINLFQSKSNKEFLETIKEIHNLIMIQEKVGKDLYKITNSRISTIAVILELSIAIAFVISFIIFMLIRASFIIYKSPFVNGSKLPA